MRRNRGPGGACLPPPVLIQKFLDFRHMGNTCENVVTSQCERKQRARIRCVCGSRAKSLLSAVSRGLTACPCSTCLPVATLMVQDHYCARVNEEIGAIPQLVYEHIFVNFAAPEEMHGVIFLFCSWGLRDLFGGYGYSR